MTLHGGAWGLCRSSTMAPIRQAQPSHPLFRGPLGPTIRGGLPCGIFTAIRSAYPLTPAWGRPVDCSADALEPGAYLHVESPGRRFEPVWCCPFCPGGKIETPKKKNPPPPPLGGAGPLGVKRRPSYFNDLAPLPALHAIPFLTYVADRIQQVAGMCLGTAHPDRKPVSPLSAVCWQTTLRARCCNFGSAALAEMADCDLLLQMSTISMSDCR